MTVCRRRNRPKLLLLLFGLTLFGYLTFFRQRSGETGAAANRREGEADPAAEKRREVDNEQLKRPVYEKPPLDLNAPGEMGRALKLNLNEQERKKEEESISRHQINTYVSDIISLHRRLPERWNPL